MRQRCSLAGARSSGFDHHQRFLPAKLSCNPHEFSPIDERLNIQRDNPRCLIFSQIRQQVNFIQICPVSIADKFRNSNTLFFSPRQNRSPQRAALRNKSHRAGGRACFQGGIQANAAADDASAIRPNNPKTILPGNLLKLLLASMITHLAETGSDNDRGVNACLAAFAQGLRNRGCWRSNHRQIYRQLNL